MTKALTRIQEFLKLEASAGLVLMAMALLAMLFANTTLAPIYSGILDTNVRIGIASFEISKPALLWINDGLMAIFFFLVGLEIKREVLAGELSSFDKAALPIIAALGGMAVPGLVYYFINSGSPETLVGWAIPTATDIAFALGILALVGSRAPLALKVFLLAVAIIDDLGAIVIIAVFYTSDLSTNALTLALLGFAVAVGLNRAGVKRAAPYVLIGVLMWVFVLKSGVHATLAGVMIALTVPMKREDGDHSLLHHLEHALHPWVAYMILPIFCICQCGGHTHGFDLGRFCTAFDLGYCRWGCFIGKQIGVMGATVLAVKTGFARLPQGVSWRHIYGIAALTGVGFTMSLFIGSLAFGADDKMNAVRLGVLLGSVVSGLFGYVILRSAPQKALTAEDHPTTG